MIHPTAEVHPTARLAEDVVVWAGTSIREGAEIGAGTSIGQYAYVGPEVVIGRDCKIQNAALLYEPARIEDAVFIGPRVVFTNDRFPRAVTVDGTPKTAADWEAVGVTVRHGASVGAGAICVAPVELGEWSTVAAGAVVTRDVAAHAIVAGVPARRVGWAGRSGRPLVRSGDVWLCEQTGERYRENAGGDAIEREGEDLARMIRAYETFRAEVIREVEAYRRDHDDSREERIAQLLADLPTPADPAPADPFRLGYSGWASARLRLSASILREHNPGYAVEVVRSPRRELGRKGRLLRYGFRVRAINSGEGGPFRLIVRGPGGRLGELASSNESVEFQRQRLNPETGRVELPGGFLDSISQATVPSDDRPDGWLASLIEENAEYLFEFANSPWGAPFRRDFARFLRRYPANERWGDRFQLTAHGLDGDYRSDLELLRVERPNPSSTEGAVPVPLLRADRDLVTVVGPGAPMPVPDSRWLRITDAEIQDGGTITTGGTLVNYESSADPIREFVSGQWLTTFGSEAHPEGVLLLRARPAGQGLDEGILIAGRSDANWFHWMVEYLPRVLRIPVDIAPDVPVLVSDRTPATGIEALRELTDRPIHVLDPTRSTPVRVVHVTAPPVQVLDTTKVPWADGLSMDRSALDALRRSWGTDAPRTEPGRRVFVARRDVRHRGIANEDRLVEVAERRGWEIVDPIALTFAEQKRLFGEAALLAGASGAVMANYLMMRPGSRILALTSRQLGDFVLPAAIAAAAGAEFSYLMGPSAVRLSDVPDRNMWNHSDFTIDPSELDRRLAALESD